MINSESQGKAVQINFSSRNVCNLGYLTEMMGWKKHLIRGVMDAFLKQIPDELQRLDDAIKSENYSTIKNVAHSMKSSVSIMGVSIVVPILQEMEDLGGKGSDIKRIALLNEELDLACKLAMEEIEAVKDNYI